MFWVIGILILFLCHTTLFIKGYSYIGYAVVLSVLTGYILFSSKWDRLRFGVISSAFVLSLLNVITEVFFKLDVFPFFDPTKWTRMSTLSCIYLTISIISGVLWSRKKKQ